MGTSVGPSLVGIGRGGDSNLVLEMDAHDAKSYPGEPTTNYAPIDLADWGTEATAVRTAAGYNFQGQPVYKCRTAVGASYQGIYKTITGLRTAASGGTVTMSIWVKNPNPSQYSFYAYIGHDFSSTRILTANSDWQRIQWTVNESSMGNDYVEYRPYTNSAAIYIHMTMPQVEVLKGYATPFVREGNGGTGTYNARPASVNLMIHGDVGTGSSFEGSSPAKHTVTAVGSPAHSGTSKFGGTAIYGGNGNAARLKVAASSVGSFGTGDFTVDFWIKSSGSQTTRSDVVALYDPGWTENFTFDFNDGSYGIWFFWNSSGGNKIRGLADGICTDGEWHHVAAVRYGTTVNLFVDGTSVGTSTESGTMGGAGASSADDWLIGNWGSGLYGWVDEMRICTGTALWTSNFTPPTRRNLSAPVVDRSGSNNGGNFATTAMTDTTTYRVGEVIRPIDSALWDFDGTDDIISCGSSSSSWQGLDTSIYWTFSVWFQIATTGVELVCAKSDSSGNNGWGLYTNGAQLKPHYGDACSISVSGGTTMSLDAWYHAVVVRDGDTGRIYLNGVQDGTDTGDTDVVDTSSYDLVLGARNSYRLEGKIGSFGVWSSALTAQQVVENFNQQRSRFKI